MVLRRPRLPRRNRFGLSGQPTDQRFGESDSARAALIAGVRGRRRGGRISHRSFSFSEAEGVECHREPLSNIVQLNPGSQPTRLRCECAGRFLSQTLRCKAGPGFAWRVAQKLECLA